MNFQILNKKQLIGNRLRMTEPIIIFNNNVKTIATHTVTADEIGRIDLIANAYYRNLDKAELILKYNNISNPFSINEGDILLIPDDRLPLVKWKRVNPMASDEISELNIRDQFINSKRLTEGDAKRVEYLKRKAAQKANGSSEILPPNILKPGEKNIIIENGKININGTR
jgi:hypothetical protein